MGAIRADVSRLSASATEIHPALDAALGPGTAREDYASARTSLLELVAAVDGLAAELRTHVAQVEALEREWAESRRYTEEGLEELRTGLEALSSRPHEAARRWLNEILDAIRASDLDAARQIAEWPLELGPERAAARDAVATLVRRLSADDAVAGLQLMDMLATRRLHEWERVLDSTIRARAHRLAAVLALRATSDREIARAHVNAAVETEPRNGVNYAERAAFSLFAGELDAAAADAERAVELAPADPAGHLMLGLWSELTGQFDEAEQLYGAALQRMTLHAAATLMRRSSLIEPSGLLLAIAAERLLEGHRPDAALSLAEAASATTVRGRAAYPDARVHRLRSIALEELSAAPAEAAAAAVDAGKRYLWNDDAAAAVRELRRALDLDARVPAARWLLADALVGTCYLDDSAVPDAAILADAWRVWHESAEMFGPPDADDSWAYLTRAIICHLRPADAGGEAANRWAAVLDVERSLIHAPWEGHRWGYAARYQRAVGLDELAFEAVQRGYELAASNPIVLEERLALLANRGDFPAASEVGRELVSAYGENPWVVGVQAWLAVHEQRYAEALPLLDVPLSAGYDLSWYYDLRALAHAALEQVDEARADYRAIVSCVADGSIALTEASAACAAAIAYAVVGELEEAERMVGGISPDDVTATDDVSLPAVRAFVALAADDLGRAAEYLENAVSITRSTRELDDLLANLDLRLSVLSGDDEARRLRDDVVKRVADETAPGHRAMLDSTDAATPDAELGHEIALAEGSAEVRSVSLLAIDARRRADRGDTAGAVVTYERLKSSLFEPEASIALARTLRSLSDEAVARGDVEAVRTAQSTLVELGEADAVDGAIAVAAALRTAGRTAEARRELMESEKIEPASAKLDFVEQNLGDLALAEGDAKTAVGHFESALELARSHHDDPARMGQLETRTAIALFAGGRVTDALQHVQNAVTAWRDAGAVEPIRAIVQDAGALLGPAVSSAAFELAVGGVTKLAEAQRAPTAESAAGENEGAGANGPS